MALAGHRETASSAVPLRTQARGHRNRAARSARQASSPPRQGPHGPARATTQSATRGNHEQSQSRNPLSISHAAFEARRRMHVQVQHLYVPAAYIVSILARVEAG